MLLPACPQIDPLSDFGRNRELPSIRERLLLHQSPPRAIPGCVIAFPIGD